MSSPQWKLEDDRKTVIITFPGNPIVQVRYDIAGIEGMIKDFGKMRAAMLPEVGQDFPLGQRVEAILDPRWATEPDIMMGDSLLHIRDPRFGWLHYLLPRDGAAKLGGYLQAQANQPLLGPPQGKAN